MTDGNLHRIASRAFKDILFGNANRKRVPKKKLTDLKTNSDENPDNLKSSIIQTHFDSPIPAPIPVPIPAPIPAPIPSSIPASSYWETSAELFEEQFLRNQQRNCYLSKSHFPVQKSNYSLLPAPNPNRHESDTDEVHQLTSAMSHSITFTPDPKKKVLPRSFSSSEVFQQSRFNEVNGDCYPSSPSGSISSDEVECKPFVGQTDTMSYYASLTFKSENQWSINDRTTISKQKTNALCEKYSNTWNSTKTAMEELYVPQSSYLIDGRESPEIPITPESIQKKVKLEHGYASFSNNSYNEESMRIPNDRSSPVSEPSPVKILECSPKYTTPKRRFSEIYYNQQSDDQNIKSVTDQTPYSPLSRTPSFQHSRNYGFRPHLPNYNAQELQTLSPGVGFVDTHCHLDFLFKRARHDDSFEAYRKVLSEYFPVSYEGCVAVFCDPYTFAKENIWRYIIEEEGVWAAFGCHPHNAMDYTESIHSSLIAALEHDKVRAFGEIGLDYSNRNKCPKAIQHRVFKRQLKLAVEMELPLVIHNREAFEDCLEIMKKHVPLNYKIHLHCCTDPWDVAKTWLDTFPNLYIGLTNVITYTSAENVHNIARNIPLDRLLLETDAPYFLPSKLPRSLRWSHPGMAIHVAAQVAVLKNVSIEETLKAVRKNTKKMYGV